MALDELHHLFLQSCMSHRYMSQKTVEAIYAKCVAASDARGAPTYEVALDQINMTMNRYGFALKRSQDEYTGKTWIAFVNTKSDDLAKMATEYNAQDISYFRSLVKKIVKSGRRFAIGHKDAINAGREESVTPALSITVAQELLKNFVARGWLVAYPLKVSGTQHIMYQLSVRSRMELEHYLLDEYPNQLNRDAMCATCSELVTKGGECGSQDCNARMHDHCARLTARRECPNCRAAWTEQSVRKIGPEAPATRAQDSSSEESEQEEDEQHAAKPESDEDELEDDDSTAQQNTSSKRKAVRPRK